MKSQMSFKQGQNHNFQSVNSLSLQPKEFRNNRQMPKDFQINLHQKYQHFSKNEYQNQRIFKISQELNKLNALIQSTQIQSNQAADLLKHCTNYSDDQLSSSSIQSESFKNFQKKLDQAKLRSKQKDEIRNNSKASPLFNLNDLQEHNSFEQDTIHMKNLKQEKLVKNLYSKNKELRKEFQKNQIKNKNSNMSKSECQKLFLHNKNSQINQSQQNQIQNFIQNDRILSYSHHFQQGQQSQFQDMSSAIEISEIKAVDTTIKKAKHQIQKKNQKNNLKQKEKSNHSQVKLTQSKSYNKKNNKKVIGTAIGLAFQKPRILSNKQKIGRIKSQNKLINNQSNFGRGTNLIKQKVKIENQSWIKAEQKPKVIIKPSSQFKDKQKSKMKLKKFMFASTSKSNPYHKNYNFNSMKGQPLKSKRNIKYNSISKVDAISNLQLLAFNSNNEKVIQKSKNQNLSKFHINLQQQVTMKISDLKLKKNLCQIQTNYLSASVKITKQEIMKIYQMKEYSDERLLKHFIIKSLIKFISQYNDQNWQDQEIDLQNSTQNQRIIQKTMKSPQKFIKVINKLPDILRRRNIVSQKRCKQFISEKVFTDQKIVQLNHNGQKNSFNSMQKDIVYIYMCQLHTYLQFLLNNSMIHQTKRSHIFNPSADTDGFFSDRSVNNANKNKNTYENANKDIQHNKNEEQEQLENHIQNKKQYDSQRKKQESCHLKRVNTAKNLKKTAKTKLKK